MTTFEVIGTVSIIVNILGVPSALIWIIKVEKCLTAIQTTCRLRGVCNLQSQGDEV